MKIYVIVDNLGYYHGLRRTRKGAKELINDMKSSGYINGFEVIVENIEVEVPTL
jgi:tRNA uridine 5-carbamoylmethylation protein Kti12